MICTKCGFNNPGDALFCEKCGSNLKSNKCPQCGFELTEGDEQFCPFCGATVNNLNDQDFDNPKKKRKGTKITIIVLSIVLAVCVIGFLVWLFLIDNGDDKQQPAQTTIEQSNETPDSIKATEEIETTTQNLQNDDVYETYADDYCHIFYFDLNGGLDSVESMEVYEGEKVSLPSNAPNKPDCDFVGWQVRRLVDNKYYYTSVYNWMEKSEGDAQGYSPSLYQPDQILLVDDSWKKGNVGNSNYVFEAVWR